MGEINIPSHRESELVILCCLMNGHKHSGEILEQLDAPHFFDPRHRIIYGKIKTLFDAGEPFGLPDVCAALDADDLESVGGAPYVASILDPLNLAHDLNHHAHRLANVAAARKIQSLAESLLLKIQDPPAKRGRVK